MERIIEVLENSFLIKKPVDNYLKGYFRFNKNFGSKDRSFISEAVYGVIRNYKRLQIRTNSSDIRVLVKSYLENNEFDKNVLDYPDFLIKNVNHEDLLFMQNNNEPHVDIRVNTLKSSVEKIMKELKPFNPIKLGKVYNGIRINKRVDFNTLKSFKEGHFEIQDEGSQIVAGMINSSKSILDYCAGAGGKSLFMADKIKNKGEIVSYDIYPEKLEELNKRAKRQGITIIETRYPFDNELFDTVIADVPCSGTGTFARNPDAKWRLVESKVEDLIKTGREILEKVKNNVKSGGSLSYITCSLMDMENIEQINWFLSKNKDFELLNQKTIRPSVDMTDGFFIANLLKK